MAQYIDKAALVAEIEKRKQRNHKKCTPKGSGAYYEDGFILDIINSINTLEVKEENEWKDARSTKPPFTSTFDGNKYSDAVLCKNKFYGYNIAQYVRLQTGYCGWFMDGNEVSITHWKELWKD